MRPDLHQLQHIGACSARGTGAGDVQVRSARRVKCSCATVSNTFIHSFRSCCNDAFIFILGWQRLTGSLPHAYQHATHASRMHRRLLHRACMRFMPFDSLLENSRCSGASPQRECDSEYMATTCSGDHHTSCCACALAYCLLLQPRCILFKFATTSMYLTWPASN